MPMPIQGIWLRQEKSIFPKKNRRATGRIPDQMTRAAVNLPPRHRPRSHVEERRGRRLVKKGTFNISSIMLNVPFYLAQWAAGAAMGLIVSAILLSRSSVFFSSASVSSSSEAAFSMPSVRAQVRAVP